MPGVLPASITYVVTRSDGGAGAQWSVATSPTFVCEMPVGVAGGAEQFAPAGIWSPLRIAHRPIRIIAVTTTTTAITPFLFIPGSHIITGLEGGRAAHFVDLNLRLAKLLFNGLRSDRQFMERGITFEIRRAGPADADDIAIAHLDSIRSIGARYYDPHVVTDWCARISADVYLDAMASGEVFYIALGHLTDEGYVLGFSSHRIDDEQHRTAVYVRGKAARLGIGSALFRAAESAAMGAGARSLHVAASLAAVEFYRANGFEEVSRGQHRLASGRLMACVFMHKSLIMRDESSDT